MQLMLYQVGPNQGDGGSWWSIHLIADRAIF